MPPIIQTFDPLSAASEAVGAFADRKRANETEQKARDYQAARDGRRDLESDRNYEIEKGKADDSHALTHSQLTTEDQNRKIAEADETFRRSMDDVNRQIAAAKLKGEITANKTADLDLQIKLIEKQYTGQLMAAKLATDQANAKTSAAAAVTAQARAALAPQQAAADLGATRAGIGATNASTAATTQRTSQDAQLFPGQLQGQVIANQGGVIANEGGRLSNAGRALQNTFERSQLSAPAVDPNLEKDYRSQVTSYTSRVNAFNKRAAANQLAPGETEPVPPVSPQDFSATLADSIDHVKENPSDLPKMLQGVDAMTGLSPYQKRQAHLALSAAIKGVTQGIQSVPYGLELRGGSKAGGPFQSVLHDAAARHGVPLSIARALMGDESSGDPNAVSSAGAVGLLQLMGPAAQEMGVTDRRDPVQNINGGLGYLAKQFKRFGSWPLALAAYNAGPEAVARHGMAALNLRGADPNYVTKILGGAR